MTGTRARKARVMIVAFRKRFVYDFPSGFDPAVLNPKIVDMTIV